MAEELDNYQDDNVDRLIESGKEKGFLTFGDVNDMISPDVTNADQLDDLLMTIKGHYA